ncbi:MAG: metallophosphoesterase [Lawsonibacter sp.]|jgi:predicted MPP superfamily phosphohydrolase
MRGGREHAWKRAALLLAAGAAAAGGWAWAVQGELTVARYEVPLPAGLEGLDGLKIAQISDVHSADLKGPLGAALAAAAPDLIVMTGDLFNREDRDLSRVLSLARMAAETAPAFFAPGNHEGDNPCWPELRDGLEEAGVQVLEDRAVLRNFRGEAVNLMGLWDVTHDPLGRAHAQAALPERVRALRREGALNVLLSHRPSLLEEYGAGGADVVFCGHAHGGQVRLPLAGPVFAPDEGLFPKHTAGVYQAGETRMVVSRGLGNGTPYPRLWNGPELVVVTMKRAGT